MLPGTGKTDSKRDEEGNCSVYVSERGTKCHVGRFMPVNGVGLEDFIEKKPFWLSG